MRLRVFIELAAVLVRTAVTAVLVLYFRQALLAFAVAQFAYSLWTTASYYAYFATRIVTQTSASQFELSRLADLLPQRLPVHCAENASALALPPPRRAFVRNGELLGLVYAFTVQSSEKLLLTEGEKFVLAGFSTQLEENGVYSLVQNLGSLVARMIFQPLEESSYAEFSNLLGPLTLRSATPTATVAASDQSVADQRKDNDALLVTASRQAVAILATLTKCVTLVGLVFVCFGPPYARVLFDLVYGARWTHTSAPVALSWYCGYVLLMAVNGVTESFLLASIPPASVRTIALNFHMSSSFELVLISFDILLCSRAH